MNALSYGNDPRPHYYLSHERIFTFERCPRRYYYSYVLFVPPDFTPYYLYLGKIVHQTLAYIESTNKPFKPFLLDHLFRLEFQEQEEIRKVYDLSLSLISNWRRWRCQREEEEVIGLEKAFELLTREGTLFKGRIDRISYQPKDRRWVISDYKTGTSKISRSQIAGNVQLRCYAWALINQEPGVDNLTVELVYLRDNDVREAQVRLPELKEVEARIDSEKEKITGCAQYPAKPGWYCKICRFQSRCSLNKLPKENLILNLKSLVEEEDPQKRASAASALGSSGAKIGASALIQALRYDDNRTVRRKAAHSLGKVGDRWTLSFLTRVLPYEHLTREGVLAISLLADRCLRGERPPRKTPKPD